MIAHNISYTLLLAYFRFLLFNFQDTLVGQSGLEPPTSRLSVVRSSQLSYGPVRFAALQRAPSKLNNVKVIRTEVLTLGRYDKELALLKSP